MAKKILLVDDSSTTLMMEQMILQRRTKYGYVTAINGEEAVAKAIEHRPDLVLMDVVMPKMNGFEACKQIRQNQATSQIPVILVTTRGEQNYVETGYQSGCNDYITKPINSAELVQLLESYLGR
jgi:PleD family two-component response regulator